MRFLICGAGAFGGVVGARLHLAGYDVALQSLARGTSGEVDYLNGEIALVGRLHGVPTPANELVRSAVLEMARQHEEPGTRDAGQALAALR